MKRSKFTDEQILAIVKYGKAGREVADLGARHAEFEGLLVADARHHRADVLPLEREVQRDGAQ